MRLVHLMIFIFGVLPWAGAQPGDLRLPTLGFVHDPVLQGIRPLRGIAGASFFGETLDVGLRLSRAAVSPRQDLALGVNAEDQHLVLLRFRADAIQTEAVTGAMQAVTTIVFSPSGQVAALVGDRIQVLTELGSTPKLRDIAPPSGGPWTAAAIGDDGQVLLSSGSAPADPVWLISSESAWQLPAPGSITAGSFRSHSTDAVAVTREGELFLIRNGGPNADVRQVFTGDERTTDPVGVYFAADGQHVYTVNRSGMIAVVELSTASVASVSCQCAPSGLESLGLGTLFRVTEFSDAPLMLFDAAATPRTWFVPAVASAAALDGRQQ